jgi:hypothetical protein
VQILSSWEIECCDSHTWTFWDSAEAAAEAAADAREAAAAARRLAADTVPDAASASS